MKGRGAAGRSAGRGTPARRGPNTLCPYVGRAARGGEGMEVRPGPALLRPAQLQPQPPAGGGEAAAAAAAPPCSPAEYFNSFNNHNTSTAVWRRARGGSSSGPRRSGCTRGSRGAAPSGAGGTRWAAVRKGSAKGKGQAASGPRCSQGLPLPPRSGLPLTLEFL